MRVCLSLFVIGLAAAPYPAARAESPASRQVGEVALSGVPEVDPALRERMLQYLNVRRAMLTGLSDDGASILVSTRFGNTQQLHAVRSPLGARRQISFYDEPVAGGAFIPGSGGRFVLFGKDQGGDERDQYYRLDLEDGCALRLTDGQSRHSGATLSDGGRYLAFTGTARNQKDFDLYVLDLQATPPGSPKRLWEVEGQYYATDFSPDESKLLVLQYLSERETHFHVVDVNDGAHQEITPPEPPLYYGGGVWHPSGTAAYFTSDRDGEFRKLYRVGFDYNDWKCLTTDIDWDVEEVAVDPAGKGIAFVVNEDGASRLYFADEWGGQRKAVEGLPKGQIGGLQFARRGGVLGFTFDSAAAPADAYTAAFPEGRLTRWTESEVGGLNPARFVEPELIRYPTFDQADGKARQIPAYYYPAPGPGPHPVVIYAHGGPESQFTANFSSLFQCWPVELGVSVIAPNIRGSTGYGRSYHQLDNGVKREDAIKDIGALLDWIATRAELDAKRVGIYGGSYGGYVVLGSLTTYPERFKAGIDVVGIASFISFLERTPEFRRDLRRAEYGDERDPQVRAVLERISPLNNAEKIKAALFVVHGRNDPRVPVGEAAQIVAKMRELGRPVWSAIADNEGHGFRKKENSDLIAVLYTMFWRDHLLK